MDVYLFRVLVLALVFEVIARQTRSGLHDGNASYLCRFLVVALALPSIWLPRSLNQTSSLNPLSVMAGQLSRAASEYGCDVIGRSALTACDDVESDDPKEKVFERFLAEARAFYEVGHTFCVVPTLTHAPRGCCRIARALVHVSPDIQRGTSSSLTLRRLFCSRTQNLLFTCGYCPQEHKKLISAIVGEFVGNIAVSLASKFNHHVTGFRRRIPRAIIEQPREPVDVLHGRPERRSIHAGGVCGAVGEGVQPNDRRWSRLYVLLLYGHLRDR